MTTTTYVDCVFDGSRFKGVSGGHSSFVGCSFRNIRIENMFALGSSFTGCVFSGSLTTVVFDRRERGGGDWTGGRVAFEGNDFREARLNDTSFRGGINLDSQ